MSNERKVAEIKFYQSLQRSAQTLADEYSFKVNAVREIKKGAIHKKVQPIVPEAMTENIVRQIPLDRLLKAIDKIYELKIAVNALPVKRINKVRKKVSKSNDS